MSGDDGLMVLVKHLLRRKGLTQRDLAARLGISPQALHQVLSGNRPGTKHMQAMAEILGIPVERLTTSGSDRTRDQGQAYGSLELAVTGEVGRELASKPGLAGRLRFHPQLQALRLADDIGIPLLQVGHWIVIDPDRRAWDGDLVLVVAADGACAIRRYVEAGTGPALVALEHGTGLSIRPPEADSRILPIVATVDPSAGVYEP